jgi:four helix bundle protein
MTFNSYRELVCWQLSVQLRNEMIEITDRPTVARNFKFCEQVGDSTRSAVSNIAEGFGRSNKVFRQYLEVSLGSLRETENHVDEALQRRYVSASEHQHLRGLAKGAHQAALGLCHYLERRIQENMRGRPQPEQPKQPEQPGRPGQPRQPEQPREPGQPG